jgi:hypothetical protein
VLNVRFASNQSEYDGRLPATRISTAILFDAQSDHLVTARIGTSLCYASAVTINILWRVNSGLPRDRRQDAGNFMKNNKSKRKPITWVKEGACWRCTSHSVDLDGYPRATVRGVRKKIARLILLKRFNGLIPRGIVGRHTCDHVWCINPAHVISGSPADNSRDMAIRGRARNKYTGKLNV